MKLTRLAMWLLLGFATGELAFDAWNADAPDALALSVALVPWRVGPAALAALLVARAKSRVEAWLFFGAEMAAVASTAWLWILVTFVKTGHANSENGVALMLLPLIQFAVLSVYTLAVIATADLVVVSQQPKRPRTILMIVLSIVCAVFLTGLGWSFGFIRA